MRAGRASILVLMTKRVLLPIALLAAVVAAVAPGSASATVACSFSSGSLNIQSSDLHDDPSIVRSGDNILVYQRIDPVTCSGQATVRNTHVITHSDGTAGGSFTVDLRGGPFSPGEVDEPGDSDEIDIQAQMGAGEDRVLVVGGPQADFWRLGKTANGAGVNLNTELESVPGARPNADLDLRDTELTMLFPDAGNDRVTANGGPEFSGPMPTRVEIHGRGGDDDLTGGDASDRIFIDEGNDLARGGAGDDFFMEVGPNSGDDVLDGGPGYDSVSWSDYATAMRVDLRLSGRQDTGAAGRDVVAGFEAAATGQGNDVLIGTDAGNELSTGEGDDVLLGLGSGDEIYGGEGFDTVSYAIAPVGVRQGVRLDLSKSGVNQDTGGAGIDRIDSIAGVIGSPFADVLTGSQADNRFEIRDGAGDRICCSLGADTVVGDVAGTDAIDADCETVNLDLRPETRIEAGPGSLTKDATPSFRFGTSKAGAGFECSIDGQPFGACATAVTLGPLADGAHTLSVRSRDLLGAADLTPAERTFSVDATAPRLTRVRLADGAALRLRLSEAATVKVVISRCAAASAERCKRFRRAATVRLQAARGANRRTLSRRVRRVISGTESRLTLTATDQAGNRSARVRLTAG